jgi:ubiquinone/menaquinone biosynthesis C-methylase UbiE
VSAVSEPDDKRHAGITQESFARQADKFDDARLTLADPGNLRWMTDAVAPAAGDAILDVASGTGHLALALAPHAREVVSFDMTAAMQAKAQAKAREQGLSNVTFALGSAEALPFADATFDKVTCRFAFHHFLDPARVLREMRRVVQPAGTLAVIDLLAPEDERLGRGYNDLERLRDPSHASALTGSAFAALFEREGLFVAGHHGRQVDVSVDRWLDLTETPGPARDAIAAALESELAGGEPTGFFPFRAEGRLHFKQTWSIYLLCIRGDIQP